MTDLLPPVWSPTADAGQVAAVVRRIAAAGLAVHGDRALGPMTTFGIGGAAAAFIEPVDVQALAIVLSALAGTTATQVPLLVVGRGSNLLVADTGFPGVVVRLGKGLRAHSTGGDRSSRPAPRSRCHSSRRGRPSRG